MTLLEIIKNLPNYQDYKADFDSVLKYFYEAGINADNDDCLVLSRIKPFFRKLTHASQALDFLNELKSHLNLPEKFLLNTPHGRTIRLLDSICEISLTALLNVNKMVSLI